MIRDCEVCNAEQVDCRPYGENGKWVCFACGMADRETTTKNFLGMLKDAGADVILTDAGPGPRSKSSYH